MNDEIIRKMPVSLIAEQSLLGSVLIDPDSLNEIADTVKSSDFYITEHAMCQSFCQRNSLQIIFVIYMILFNYLIYNF